MRRFLVLGLTSLIALAGSGPALAQAGKPRFGTFGVDLTSMDKTVKPGDAAVVTRKSPARTAARPAG